MKTVILEKNREDLASIVCARDWRLTTLVERSGLDPAEDFRGLDLRGITIFPDEDISGYDFSQSDLSGAVLCGVDLRRAIFDDTDLSSADLRDALYDANLWSRAIGFETAVTRGAAEYLDPPPKGLPDWEGDDHVPSAYLPDPAFRADVLGGLDAKIPAIPARWFYDHRGSELFEEITRLPEYYPTRTETALLESHSGEIASMVGSGRAIIEFGSGSSMKTPILLRALRPSAYVPVDISGDFLRESATALQRQFPELPISPVEADFTRPFDLPWGVRGAAKLGFFPGSTIGNFVARSAVDLLRAMKETLGEGAKLVIGMDRIKDVDTLVRAYDDAAGVTAAFNLNLLHRINAELDGDIPVEAFRHRAIWNDALSRIEMHLEAVRDVRFSVCGKPFSFKVGETIHTENSHKYGYRDSRLLLRAAGWGVVAEYTDEREWFSILLAEAEPPRFAP